MNSFNSNTDAQFFLNDNRVLIAGGKVDSIGSNVVNGALTGAYVNAIAGHATMTNNSVTITGGSGQAVKIFGATFYGESGTELATFPDTVGIYNSHSAHLLGNSVTILDPQFTTVSIDPVTSTPVGQTSQIAGAYAQVTNFAIAENNTVNIHGGTFTHSGNTAQQSSIMGAYLEATKLSVTNGPNNSDVNSLKDVNSSVSLTAKNNQVNITGGSIESLIAGAVTYVSDSGSKITANISIQNNTISISGGTFVNEQSYGSGTIGIFGGLVQSNIDTNDTYSISNNTVNIGFDTKLAGGAGGGIDIGGGIHSISGLIMMNNSNFAPNPNAYDGNTLNLYHLKNANQKAGAIANFENINFVLGLENSSTQLASNALIELDDTLYLGNGYDGIDKTITAGAIGAQITVFIPAATKFANFGLHTSVNNTH